MPPWDPKSYTSLRAPPTTSRTTAARAKEGCDDGTFLLLLLDLVFDPELHHQTSLCGLVGARGSVVSFRF